MLLTEGSSLTSREIVSCLGPTHGTIAMLLGAAARGESRRSLLRGMLDAIVHRASAHTAASS